MGSKLSIQKDFYGWVVVITTLFCSVLGQYWCLGLRCSGTTRHEYIVQPGSHAARDYSSRQKLIGKYSIISKIQFC